MLHLAFCRDPGWWQSCILFMTRDFSPYTVKNNGTGQGKKGQRAHFIACGSQFCMPGCNAFFMRCR